MKEIEVVAGIILHDSKILCTQRGKDKNGYVSFMWEFPGGKVEPNESNENALKRELMEELSLNVELIKYFCTSKYSYPTFNVVMHCYICKTTTKSPKLNVHLDYKWLKTDELDTLNWAYADRPVVDKLIKSSL